MENKPKNDTIDKLKALRDKAKDPGIKDVIDKKINQVTKPFNK